jgi:hypothetical protein
VGTTVLEEPATATFKLEECSSLPKYIVLCSIRINLVQHRFIASAFVAVRCREINNLWIGIG